jgi:hypothetical protein
MNATPSPTFRRVVDDASQGLVLTPIIQAYLYEAKFPDVFTMTFHKEGGHRKPDGYFHPSTHPLMTARQLYYYMTEPDRWVQAQLSYESRMAVTMGTAVHGFMEMCLYDAGVLVKPTGTCPSCKREYGKRKNQCNEPGAADEELRSRGHMDGVMEIDLPGKIWIPGQGGFEFKSTNPRKVMNIEHNDLEWFKEKCPDYYAQVQEYMRISGMRQFIVLFLAMGYPWAPLEIQVPYDPDYANRTAAKYALVRKHQEAGVPPEPCCAIKSKEARQCPARRVCPVGMAS